MRLRAGRIRSSIPTTTSPKAGGWAATRSARPVPHARPPRSLGGGAFAYNVAMLFNCSSALRAPCCWRGASDAAAGDPCCPGHRLLEHALGRGNGRPAEYLSGFGDPAVDAVGRRAGLCRVQPASPLRLADLGRRSVGGGLQSQPLLRLHRRHHAGPVDAAQQGQQAGYVAAAAAGAGFHLRGAAAPRRAVADPESARIRRRRSAVLSDRRGEFRRRQPEQLPGAIPQSSLVGVIRPLALRGEPWEQGMANLGLAWTLVAILGIFLAPRIGRGGRPWPWRWSGCSSPWA